MDKHECKQIIDHMSYERKTELVKMLVEQQYSAMGCILTPLDWAGGYSASFEKKKKSYKRNILVVQANEDCQAMLAFVISWSIQRRSMEPMYNSLDCYVFTTVDNKAELESDADLDHSMKVAIHDLNTIITNVISV